jgi:carbon monoxide dehydrogenase subunit G
MWTSPLLAYLVSVQIDRPPEEVFAFVADARNRPLWDESVDTEELTSPEPIGVGSTVRTGLRSMGRDYVLTWEIVEFQPPTRQRIESTSGPFPTTLVYELSGQDEGTLVEFSITGRPSGALRLLQPLLASNTQKNLDRAFPRLKRHLEAG